MKGEDRRRTHVLVFMQPPGKPGVTTTAIKGVCGISIHPGCMRILLEQPFSRCEIKYQEIIKLCLYIAIKAIDNIC